MKVGIHVICVTCGIEKAPVGRSLPIGMYRCHPTECDGYYHDPMPGSLWPGESEYDFGYSVNADGTEERSNQIAKASDDS